MEKTQQPCNAEGALKTSEEIGKNYNITALKVHTHPTHISVLPLCICHVTFKVILGGGPQLLRYQCQEPVSDNKELHKWSSNSELQ